MRKILKILFITLGTLILLLGLAAALIAGFVNPNTFKDEISQYVQSETGRTLTITGDLHWSFFPWVGIKFSGATLGNTAAFSDHPFATIGEADINIKLWPLLWGELDAGKITLHALHLNLLRNPSGESNWDDLTKPEDISELSSTPKLKAPPSTPLALQISSIDIINSTITWSDEQAKKALHLTRFNLHSKDIQLNKPFPLSFSFDYQTKHGKRKGHLAFSSQATLDMERMFYALKQLSITGKYHTADLKLQGDIVLDLKKQLLTAKTLNVSLGGLRSQISVVATQILSEPKLEGTIFVAPFNPTALAKALDLTLRPSIKKANLNARFLATSDAIKLLDIQFGINGAHITGDLDLKSLAKKQMDFKLNVDTVNLSHFKLQKPPKKTQGSASTPSAPSKPWTINGTLGIKQLITRQSRLNHVRLKLAKTGNTIRLSPISASLYRGKFLGHLTIDTRKRLPRYRLDAKLTNLRFSRANKLAFTSQRLAGTLSLSAKLRTLGTTNTTLLRNLSGSGRLTFQNGGIYGKTKLSIKRLSGSFSISKGTLSNRDFFLDFLDGKATGRGTINLLSKRLNYRLFVTTKNRHIIKLVPQLGRSGTLKIPFIVSGTLDNPRIVPDFPAIAAEVIKNSITKPLINNPLQSVFDNLLK